MAGEHRFVSRAVHALHGCMAKMSEIHYRLFSISLAGLWLLVVLYQGSIFLEGIEKSMNASEDENVLAQKKREKLQATLIDLEQELSRCRFQSKQARESLRGESQEIVVVIDSAARQSKVSVKSLNSHGEISWNNSDGGQAYQLRAIGYYNNILKFIEELSQANMPFIVAELTLVTRDWKYPIEEPLEARLRFEPVPPQIG